MKTKAKIIDEIIEKYEDKIKDELVNLGNENLSQKDMKEIKIQIKHWGKIISQYEDILNKK